MSMLEDRVRAALTAHAEDFPAQPDAWRGSGPGAGRAAGAGPGCAGRGRAGS